MASLPPAAPPAAQTLSVLRTQTRNSLNETSTIFWGNSEIDFAINLCKDELWKVIREAREDFFLYRSSTTPYRSLSIVANTHSYELWSDLVEIRQIIPDPSATDGTEEYTYTPLDVSHPDFIAARLTSTGTTATSGYPSRFFYDIIGSQHDGVFLLHIAPTPQIAHTTFITYIRSLPDMTSDDHTCDIPPEHHKIIVPMAADFLMKKDRDNGYAIWREDWKERLAGVKASIAYRQTAKTEYVQRFDPER